MATKSVLIAKDSEEHERYFQAFIDHSVIRWKVEDMFGDTQEVKVRVFSVEHVGDKTRFVFRSTR